MKSIFSMISETSDGVLVVDCDQRVVFCNEAATAILRIERPDIVGEHCFGLLAAKDEAGCPHCRRDCGTMAMAERGELVPTRELRASVNGGEAVWLSVSTVLLPPKWRHISALIHLFRDISHQKAVGREVEQLLDCARRVLALQRAGAPGTEPPPMIPAANLTNREKQVLQLLASGASTVITARKLRISNATVKNHVQSILAKFGVHTRLEAVTTALRNGLLRDH